MSTRAVIARPAGDGFAGRYHHWDGYPSGLGATLFALRRDRFGGDTDAMLRVLIDDHPAGWSTINGADWSLAPGFDGSGPQCYCHGSRHESGWLATDKDAAGSGCEYAYVLHGQTMTILSSYSGDRKMIGAFGMGDPDSTWRPIAVVNLDGPEPDWKKIEDGQP